MVQKIKRKANFWMNYKQSVSHPDSFRLIQIHSEHASVADPDSECGQSQDTDLDNYQTTLQTVNIRTGKALDSDSDIFCGYSKIRLIPIQINPNFDMGDLYCLSKKYTI